MKRNLASLELAALVNELQVLSQAKISQIYHQGEEFLFQLHTKEGKKFLRILPGRFLNLTQAKETFPPPSSLCLQLRKYLDQAYIRRIWQKEAERIVIFELEKSEEYFLIVELFAPGNLILTQADYQVIACSHPQEFKDRRIAPKEKYQFPPPALNWKALTEKQLEKIFQKSGKRSLVLSLAIDLGLGGLYAEEVCQLNNLNKNKLPNEIEEKEVKLVIKTLKNFLELIKKPAGYLYEERITPFPLINQKEKQKTATYNQAWDTLKPETASPYQTKIDALQRIIKQQAESRQKLQEDVSLNTQKAEAIYYHYQPLKRLLEIVRELKKTQSWGEIEKELKKERKIKKVDLKEKKVVIDL